MGSPVQLTMQAGDNLLAWLLTTLALLYKDDSAGDSQEVTKEAASPSSRPFTVLVEGNVGSGKSTFLDIMDSWQGVKVLQEPVEIWRNVGGQNLFNDMVSQPKRWMTTFQLFSTMTRTKQSQEAARSRAPVVMIERSLFSERDCFVQMLYETGVITSGEFALLDRFFTRMTRNMKVDLIVYIRSDPSILQSRIVSRGRVEEEGLSSAYLEELHTRHEEWLVREQFPVPAPVIVLDGN